MNTSNTLRCLFLHFKFNERRLLINSSKTAIIPDLVLHYHSITMDVQNYNDNPQKIYIQSHPDEQDRRLSLSMFNVVQYQLSWWVHNYESERILEATGRRGSPQERRSTRKLSSPTSPKWEYNMKNRAFVKLKSFFFRPFIARRLLFLQLLKMKILCNKCEQDYAGPVSTQWFVYKGRPRTSMIFNNLAAFDALVRMKAREDCNAKMADVVIDFLKAWDGVWSCRSSSKGLLHIWNISKFLKSLFIMRGKSSTRYYRGHGMHRVR